MAPERRREACACSLQADLEWRWRRGGSSVTVQGVRGGEDSRAWVYACGEDEKLERVIFV
jgi:hypothetical protein